ncbi:MAG: shikimate dehydrogenase [Clostridia bacterium]|nr:shikimate dehydrogenase [Clostridia bacterium]
MKIEYGCIGERLKHSFSKEIHNALADYDYRIVEVPREELESFALEHSFRAINVTIPYKEMIMPYLYSIDAHAATIGAVNTVVNRDGRLYGYNTDFYGMKSLLDFAGISLRGKKVVILGTGGTSKTAYAVAGAEGARVILRVSRSGREDAITYEELYARHTDAQVIINTTPSGMYPNIFTSAVDISHFPSLDGVIDAVYNPLRTPLVLSAMKRGIAAMGGLYMLVAQAVRASEIFTDTSYPSGELERVYRKILAEKENIVLIGMPASGKSTVARLLKSRLGRTVIDTDELIVRRAGKSIPEIFAEVGEAGFRELEAEAVREASASCGVIIATGGGAVLRSENVDALRENGRLYFIDRPLEALVPTRDRPTASDRAAIEQRYAERYDIYCAAADVRIDATGDSEAVSKIIEGEFFR